MTDPSTAVAANPARAAPAGRGGLATIVTTAMVGRIYDGGASDIGYAVSVDGGQSWKEGLLPLAEQGGRSDTCAGPLNRAGAPVTANDKRHDFWLVTSLGFSGMPEVAAVCVNRGTLDFTNGGIAWGPPICTHITQPSADAPDKPWITCDNSPTSKGYGNCYFNFPSPVCTFLDPANLANQCNLRVGFVSSIDGGTTWSEPTYPASMALPKLVRSSQGVVVGDHSGALRSNAWAVDRCGPGDDDPAHVRLHVRQRREACTRASPCQGFAAAIAKTSAGGEVVVLDSGGYGTFAVDKEVSVIGAPGRHVAISVFSGTGIDVDAAASDTVVLGGTSI